MLTVRAKAWWLICLLFTLWAAPRVPPPFHISGPNALAVEVLWFLFIAAAIFFSFGVLWFARQQSHHS